MTEYIRYIKIAINRPPYVEVLNICEAENKKIWPDNNLGVNENNAGTLAVIKVESDNLDWIDTLPMAPQQVLEESPVALVRAVSWTGQ